MRSKKWSPSSRRAWIEIGDRMVPPTCGLVALLAEGVDRNPMPGWNIAMMVVALLAEGVDRNR